MMLESDPLEHLLLAAGGGDHGAFQQLYQRTAPKLFALCRRMLHRDELAEQALQAAFVQIWRDAAHYDPGRLLPLAWMGVIVRRCCLAASHRRYPGAGFDDEIAFVGSAEDPAGPLELAVNVAESHALAHCLRTLSERQRMCITLVFYRGFTQHRLGRYLATPETTVKGWIRRGLQRLGKCLQG